MKKIAVLHEKDNVGTVLQAVDSGESVIWTIKGEERRVTVTEKIPLGHKVALVPVGDRQEIVKYGEVIGVARGDIGQGALVHVHNVESLRGRGDLAEGGKR